jgi:hypothetical protein
MYPTWTLSTPPAFMMLAIASGVPISVMIRRWLW